MLRRALLDRESPIDSEGFRLRGTEVSRMEGLADGVFALAMTLLILSSEVPQTFGELREAIKSLPIFAICFAILMWYWGEHNKVSRRYGLHDKTSIVLTSLLLFLVLFYVYPLKFLFTYVVNWALYHKGTNGAGAPILANPDVPQLFLLYGIGGGSIALVFLLLHRHALRRRDELGLTPVEQVIVRGEIAKCICLMAICACSIAMAYLLPTPFVGLAGIFYSTVGLSEGGLSWYYGRKVGRMQAAQPS